MKTRLVRYGAWLAAVVGIFVVPASGDAQPRSCTAATLARLAAVRRDECSAARLQTAERGACLDALERLQRSDACLETTYVLATAYHDRHRCASASDLLRGIGEQVAVLRPDMEAGMRALLRQSDACRASIRFRVTPPADGIRVTVDGRGQELVGGIVYLDVGSRAVTISAPGYATWTGTAEVGEGAPLVLPVALTPSMPDPPPEPSPVHVLGWSLAASGAALAITGAVFWGLSADAADEMANACAEDAAHPDSRALCQARQQFPEDVGADEVCARAGDPVICARQSRVQALAWGLGLGGLATAAIGLTMVFVSRAPTTRVRIEPSISPRASGVVLRWSF